MNNQMTAKYFLLIGSVIMVVFLVEGISGFILKKNESLVSNSAGIKRTNLYNIERDSNLGHILKKNNKHHALKFFPSGKISYDVIYTTDEFRRRTVGQEYLSGNNHLILFGCSWAFGEGLNDKETLQYLLYKKMPQYNVYNYAVFGYGPQNMLALLETKRLPLEVQSNKGLAIYYFGSWDFDRAIGSMRAIRACKFPYYRLDKNGRIERKGTYETGRPFISYIYQFLDKLAGKSNFLRLINFKLPLKLSKQDIRLTAEIIKEARKQYNDQFAGEFYVLINSLEKKQDLNIKELVSVLEKAGIVVLYYPLEGKGYLINGDGHPSGKLNEFLANNLIGDLNHP